MKKFKIFTTILVLYEFVMLTILQIPRYCSVFFSSNFCINSFKYFFICIEIPVLFLLAAWWVPDVSKRICKNCQCEQEKNEQDNRENIERLITGAMIMGMQKFISKHPKAMKTFNDILSVFENTGKNKAN